MPNDNDMAICITKSFDPFYLGMSYFDLIVTNFVLATRSVYLDKI